jgi:PTS system nitrogen regulatory IIA component
MGNDMMDLEELADYLQRDARELNKLASRGHLPGHKVSGRWRFARAEINHWLETQLPEYTEEQLSKLDSKDQDQQEPEPLICNYLAEASVAVPMMATTRASALRELVRLVQQSWQVYDPDAILKAVEDREEMGSTGLDTGVALPHPHRPLPAAVAESVIAYGRTASGIPFGGAGGGLTDIFFLFCCQDETTHMRILARLSRLLLRPGFMDDLRMAQNPTDTWQLIQAAEKELA